MSGTAQVQDETHPFRRFDSGRCLLFNVLFPCLPDSRPSFWRQYLLPYVSSAVATYGVIFVCAFFTLPSLTEKSCDLRLPFLFDWNVACMFLATFPAITMLIATERKVLRDGLSGVCDNEVLKINPSIAGKLACKWEKKYRTTNIYGQVTGIFVGGAVAAANYMLVTDPTLGFWAVTDGAVNLPGWVYLASLFLFYFTVTVFVLRLARTISFLRHVVDKSDVQLIPFHPDHCGGLQPVGALGLRNQYLLAVAGVNIILLFSGLLFLDPSGLLYVLFGLAVALYLVAGPVTFLGPLMPFRDGMMKSKRRLMELVTQQIKAEFEDIEKLLKNSGIESLDEKRLTKLQKLGELVEKLPIWPFDTTTRRKFLSAYVGPIIGMFATPLLAELIKTGLK